MFSNLDYQIGYIRVVERNLDLLADQRVLSKEVVGTRSKILLIYGILLALRTLKCFKDIKLDVLREGMLLRVSFMLRSKVGV